MGSRTSYPAVPSPAPSFLGNALPHPITSCLSSFLFTTPSFSFPKLSQCRPTVRDTDVRVLWLASWLSLAYLLGIFCRDAKERVLFSASQKEILVFSLFCFRDAEIKGSICASRQKSEGERGLGARRRRISAVPGKGRGRWRDSARCARAIPVGGSVKAGCSPMTSSSWAVLFYALTEASFRRS